MSHLALVVFVVEAGYVLLGIANEGAVGVDGVTGGLAGIELYTICPGGRKYDKRVSATTGTNPKK